MEKKLEVKNLIISFRTQGGKVQAVRDISFDLYKGETLAIVGESGSGKSVTNRAIIGILAGNSIVEGGEIIYDGQDLLKISEDEFHKIRGDKIAMIFQDPMSSLNPIMKVGKQLTEAMLLKAGATRKNARRSFNGKLKVLNGFMDAVSEDEAQKQQNKDDCKTFDNFCIQGTKLESAYNEILRKAVELQLFIDDKLFLISKNQHVDCAKFVKTVLKRLPETAHPDIVVLQDERLQQALSVLTQGLSNGTISAKSISDEAVQALQSLSEFIEQATKRPKPNYFTLGYYMMRNPEANVDDLPIEELTEMTRKYLDEQFMLAFIEKGANAVAYSHSNSIALKKQLLEETAQTLEFFRGDFSQKEAFEVANNVAKKVEDAIDRLQVVKNGAEHIFRSSLNAALHKYFDGVKKNPKEQARFDRQQAKYDALVAKGKTPDWKVVPAALVDLDLAKKNIRAVIHNLRALYRKDIEGDAAFDSNKAMVDLIDYFKEQASAVVYKLTKKMAKAKALK